MKIATFWVFSLKGGREQWPQLLLDGSGVSPNTNSAAKTTVDMTDKGDDHESDGSELEDVEKVGKSVVDHYITTDSYGKLR